MRRVQPQYDRVVEAGTGTGKTSPICIRPSVALDNKERCVVSTNTINLRISLYFKDLPAMREALGCRSSTRWPRGATTMCA